MAESFLLEIPKAKMYGFIFIFIITTNSNYKIMSPINFIAQ